MPIAWDEAFATIAAALNALASPDEAIFYTSGRASNEAAFLYQLFVREFGTNNLPDCSNMCHEASGVALTEQLGSGKGTVTLEDFEQADAIFIFGQNPGTNHPRMLGELRDAAKRGCRIVAFNPLRERGLERFANPQIAGRHARRRQHARSPRTTSSRASAATSRWRPRWPRSWSSAMRVDRDFIAAHTRGFDAFAPALRADAVGRIWSANPASSRAQLEHAARIYIDSDATILCWGMGITQHARSVATIQMLANLLLLRGNIGRPGAGPCPVRGHSNVQGDRTMGIYEKPSPAFLDRLGRGLRLRSRRASTATTPSARSRRCTTAAARCSSPWAATSPPPRPTPRAPHAALRRCELTVHVSTKLNRSHLVHGRAGADPAVPGPHRDRPAGRRPAGGDGRGFDEHGAPVVGHEPAGFAAPAVGAGDRRAAGRGDAAAQPDAVAGLIEDYDRIRERIAAGHRRLRGLQRARARPPAASTCTIPAASACSRPTAARRSFVVHPLCRNAR